MRNGLVFCAALIAATAGAAHIEEKLTLTNGWNAVYIESTPENPDAAEFFKVRGVTKASCYISSVYSATAQIASDGADISQKPVSHFIYDANKPDDSTLKNINGGLVYLIFATNATSTTFFGTPQIPHVSWQVSDSGFATLVPILSPKGEEVLATDYFDGAPCGTQNAFNAWTIFGSDDTVPTFAPISAIMFTRKPKVKGGGAYALESEAAGDWAGVLEVSAGLSGALDFKDGESRASLSVRNTSTKERDVQISLVNSALGSEYDFPPTLNLYIPQTVTEASRWEAFSSTNATIAAGESRTFLFQCDKSGLSEGDKRAAVLSVEDLGDTKMRVRLPVTAEADTYPEGEAAYPAGLWIGTAKLLQVALDDANHTLAAAGGILESLILLHVDTNGVPKLLQRVAVGQEDGDENMPPRTCLYADITNAPAGVSPRRISSVFLDTTNRVVTATGDSAAKFGEEATFRFIVGERSKENPFRHPWHPDHDGRTADYSGDAPSGDSPDNFIGPVKPESFSITNTVTFTWRDDNEKPTYSRTPDETTFGRLDWILSGLRNEPIHIRGIFAMKRVCAATEIKE